MTDDRRDMLLLHLYEIVHALSLANGETVNGDEDHFPRLVNLQFAQADLEVIMKELKTNAIYR